MINKSPDVSEARRLHTYEDNIADNDRLNNHHQLDQDSIFNFPQRDLDNDDDDLVRQTKQAPLDDQQIVVID
jgi:hypothetical protein